MHTCTWQHQLIINTIVMASKPDIPTTEGRFSLDEYIQFSAMYTPHHRVNEEGLYESLDNELSLGEVLDAHKTELPIQVLVCDTLASQDIQVAPGDKLNIHFIKDTKVVKAINAQGDSCVIPLSSAYQCNIVEHAKAGKVPPVMYVKGKSSNLKKNEVLLVEAIHYTDKNKRKVESLDCWSITEQEERLNIRQLCQLGTSLLKTKVYLQDVIDRLQWPLTIRMDFKDREENLELLQQLTVRSIIASITSSDVIIEILLPQDMKVIKCELSSSDKESLYHLTRILYWSFDPSLVEKVVGLSQDSHPHQSELFTNVIGWSGSAHIHKPLSMSTATHSQLPSPRGVIGKLSQSLRRRAKDDKEAISLKGQKFVIESKEVT